MAGRRRQVTSSVDSFDLAAVPSGDWSGVYPTSLPNAFDVANRDSAALLAIRYKILMALDTRS
jgi:hypothetical protein